MEIQYFQAKVEDLRVAVGVDFGTTFSGFAYAFIQKNKTKTEVIVNEEWGHFKSPNKTNTVLQYNEYGEVLTWGVDALGSEPSRRRANNSSKTVEAFKFYLGDVPESKKPQLPSGITFEKAITDYLGQMEKIENHWPGIDFYKHVRLVFTVPAEFDEKSKTIMRKCIYNAGLVKSIGTLNLQFTTEPEAAAIHCMNRLKELNLKTGATYLVVDCGGGTVDLTVRKLLSDDRIAETTERSGDYCGGTYVDDEFLKFLEGRVGKSAMNMLKKKHRGQVNYLVHKYFCPEVKIPFAGEKSKFKTIELDIQKKCPALMQYVNSPEREQLSDEDEWIIDLDFDTVKSFFDPVLRKIFRLIDMQLSKCSDCSVMFLVGGFSESRYLQFKIKEGYESRLTIAIPPSPAAAIEKGACEYGLDMKTVSTRVLKWTYGTDVFPKWKSGDPSPRKTAEGLVAKFYLMASKGTEVDVNKEFSATFIPVYPEQDSMELSFYYTSANNAKYCDEPGMKKLGSFTIDLPDIHLGTNRPVLISLCFASMEATVVTAKNKTNGKVYRTTFSNEE
ncbi:11567_t:CDS:2 [Ambispora leptoticha]|uniref:11567_t:CDS:1 n=1 Tax=Ambispora leptoticha TaxID=144679 RepID=A0A9N9C6Y0_9GLOM|nr:11567_t:CDS:2 [Ambispora leptoticha]